MSNHARDPFPWYTQRPAAPRARSWRGALALVALLALALLALSACTSEGTGEAAAARAPVVVNYAPVVSLGHGNPVADSYAAGETSEGDRSGLSGTSAPTTSTSTDAAANLAPPAGAVPAVPAPLPGS